MKSYIYVSDVIEITRTEFNELEYLTAQLLPISERLDISLLISEQDESLVVMFTYNSEKILEIDEMKCLDKRFIKGLMKLKKVLLGMQIELVNP